VFLIHHTEEVRLKGGDVEKVLQTVVNSATIVFKNPGLVKSDLVSGWSQKGHLNAITHFRLLAIQRNIAILVPLELVDQGEQSHMVDKVVIPVHRHEKGLHLVWFSIRCEINGSQYGHFFGRILVSRIGSCGIEAVRR